MHLNIVVDLYSLQAVGILSALVPAQLQPCPASYCSLTLSCMLAVVRTDG
jgi:hypothetical protein